MSELGQNRLASFSRSKKAVCKSMYRFFLIKIWKKNNLDSYSNLIILSLLSLQNSWKSFWWLYFQSILQRHYFPINFVFLIRIHLEILFLISIFRSIHQKIEDHHIDEVIKYYWCISNHTKIKDEKKKASICLCFLCLSIVTICMTRVIAECRNSIRYVSFFSLSLSFSYIYLFAWLNPSRNSRIAFLLVILSNILPLQIESKLVLLLKYNIIVGESREKRESIKILVESHSITSSIILNSSDIMSGGNFDYLSLIQ
jgi:hypothetical protein